MILRQEFDFDPAELSDEVKQLKSEIEDDAERLMKIKRDELISQSPAQLELAMTSALEKGASSWVTAVPLYDHGTVLHKGDFVDAVYMRYGWELPELPCSCPCGSSFSLQHALDCKLGGFRIIQHNEVRDLFAEVMREAGHVVESEPRLQRLGEVFEYKSANVEDDARSDLKVAGFWREWRQAFFDIKVVSPFARSYSNMTQSNLFKMPRKRKCANIKNVFVILSMETSTRLSSPLLEGWLLSAKLLLKN